MRRTVAALCASAALMGVGPAAVAHTTSEPTEVVLVSYAQTPPGTYHVQGYLNTSSKCRANRRVKIFFVYSGSVVWTLVDEDTSSLNGNWAGSGPAKGSYATKIRVTRKNVGRPGHRHICEPDTLIDPRT